MERGEGPQEKTQITTVRAASDRFTQTFSSRWRKEGTYERSCNMRALLGKNKWAAQENSGSRTETFVPRSLESERALISRVLRLVLTAAQSSIRSCFLHQPSGGAKVTMSRVQSVKTHLRRGSGLGPNTSKFKHHHSLSYPK